MITIISVQLVFHRRNHEVDQVVALLAGLQAVPQRLRYETVKESGALRLLQGDLEPRMDNQFGFC